MRSNNYFFLVFVWLLISVLIQSNYAQNSNVLLTPKEHFGFEPGSDRMLFNYQKLINYLKILDAKSSRLKLVEIGTSPLGLKIYIAFISSEQNIDKLDRLKEINRIETEIKDRFGKLPTNVLRILKWIKIKISAESLGIRKVDEGIQSFTCEFENALSKDQIRRLVTNIKDLKFSYKNEILNVSVPRDAIFNFLETCKN